MVDIEMDDGDGGDVDDQIEVVFKPFTKEQAGYKEVEDDDFDNTHRRCASCAHWDGKGHCHIVPNALANEYCEQFYSDVGVFAHEHDDYIEENLILYGEHFMWDTEDVKEFSGDIRERLEQKVRSMRNG